MNTSQFSIFYLVFIFTKFLICNVFVVYCSFLNLYFCSLCLYVIFFSDLFFFFGLFDLFCYYVFVCLMCFYVFEKKNLDYLFGMFFVISFFFV